MTNSRSRRTRAALFLAIVAVAGCRRPSHHSVEIATTTSLEGSGLLPVIAQGFLRDTGVELHPFVVGSGRAMRLAEQGKVCLIITHDPDAEREFVSRNHPLLYRQFMWNHFVIVGPRADPANLRSATGAVDAFSRVLQSRAKFCSRNDESATSTKELALWRAAGATPTVNPNYLKMGQPMAALLRSADALSAYALSDRATFDRLAHQLNLEIVFQGDPILRNVYAVTLLRPAGRISAAEQQNAQRFAEWLLSGHGRDLIAHYSINGHREFHVIP